MRFLDKKLALLTPSKRSFAPSPISTLSMKFLHKKQKFVAQSFTEKAQRTTEFFVFLCESLSLSARLCVLF